MSQVKFKHDGILVCIPQFEMISCNFRDLMLRLLKNVINYSNLCKYKCMLPIYRHLDAYRDVALNAYIER